MALKQKSKDTLDLIAGNPKISATEAYIRTHSTNNRKSANASVHKLLAKPSSQIYLKKHIDKAREKIVELVDTEKLDIALKASQDILDRTQGKAVQRQQVQSSNLIHISLGNITEVKDAEA